MASNLPYPNLLKKTRLKKRAPVYNTQDQLHFFYYPFKNIRGFYEYFMSHLLKNEQLRDEPDGIYTWVMTETRDLYAMRTRSSQEIGTLHGNIILYIELREQRKPAPLAAGELQLITDPVTGEKQVKFNFQSSFFVAEILKKQTKKRKLPENEFQSELARDVSIRFKELFPDRTIMPVLGVDLIEPTRFLSLQNTINAYNRFLTRKNVLPEHRALTHSQLFQNSIQSIQEQVAATAANVQQVAKEVAQVNANSFLKNHPQIKHHKITNIQPFQPSEPLTGFSIGVKNNISKNKTRRKSRK